MAAGGPPARGRPQRFRRPLISPRGTRGRTSTTYDPSVSEGWFKRPYSWQGNIGLQQELAPGVGLNVTYYRTWYGNFGVAPGLASFAQNTLVAASDFRSYCVAAPVDSRLPGGG